MYLSSINTDVPSLNYRWLFMVVPFFRVCNQGRKFGQQPFFLFCSVQTSVVLPGKASLILPIHTGNFSHRDATIIFGKLFQFKDTKQYSKRKEANLTLSGSVSL